MIVKSRLSYSLNGGGYAKIFFALLCVTASSRLNAQESQLKLWYDKPAVKWTDALPIGNGRLGAMIYGGATEDHVQFNEATLWTGGPRPYARPGAVKYLQPIRQLLFEGKQEKAETLAAEHFMGLKYPDDSLYASQKKEWLQQVRTDTSFAAASLNDKNWKDITILTPNGWENDGPEQGLDGAVWFRASFNVPASMTGKDLVMDLGRIRDVDYTYINGRLVGTAEGISTKRSYIVSASLLKPGKNSIAVQVLNYYDKGGFIGIKEDRRIFVLYPKGGDSTNAIALPAVWKYKIQNDKPPQFPQYEASYQPFGDLWLRFKGQQHVAGYRRELDIANAVSTVSYTNDAVRYTRTYFAAASPNAVIIHCAADKKGKINFDASLKSAHKGFTIEKIDKNTFALFVQPRNGALKGAAYLYISTSGGTITAGNDKMTVSNANDATIYLTAATSFNNYKDVSGDPAALCKQALQEITTGQYDKLRETHIQAYKQLFNTLSFDLPIKANASLPTDQRIQQFSVEKDPSFLSLYLQYGRYLMIAASQPGATQPANLQGLWNDLLTPPWGSKYTTNINLEMNYWPAEPLNLSSCTAPLFNMLTELSEAGKQTAREHYGLPGWVLHHNTDLWRGTAPINASNHGVWVTGAAWLCQHIWEHYLFTQDKSFLQKNYPIMRSAAEFYAGFLVKDPVTGWLISTPSNSPEQGGLVAGPAMDHQIIRELFKNCIAAAGILNTDQSFSKTLHQKYDQIAPNQKGRHGQLQEWMQDIDDVNNRHRHVSHLWGVFPGTDITWQDSTMMKAARQSLLYRGDGGTGWSLAWKVNLWARMKDGDHTLKILNALFEPAVTASGAEKGGVYNNMFDAHPPFQIDGNFGGAAGIGEMLLQSHGEAIELLPALPGALSEGEIKGLCARGGFVVNIKWSNGKLQSAEILSMSGNTCRVRYDNKQMEFTTVKGKVYRMNGALVVQ
jgi:alpha-L-fucosidase 2